MAHHETSQPSAGLYERALGIAVDAQVTLGARIYEPHDAPRGNVLMIGAVGVPQRFYGGFARTLARAGLRVLTFDYRGIGASRPARLRGYEASLTDWAERDYPTVLSWLLTQYGALPTLAAGHSLGGQIVALAPNAHALAGVFTVASQSGYAGNFRDPWRMQLLWRAWLPSVVSVAGYAPSWAGLGEDLPRGVAREWARWCLSPEYFLAEHPEYRPKLASFDKPILAYSFTDDHYAPLVNVRWLHARYAAAQIEHRHVDPRELGLSGIGHVGFFRERASGLWREALHFFDARLTEQPESARRTETLPTYLQLPHVWADPPNVQ